MTQPVLPPRYKFFLIASLFVFTALLLTACPFSCCAQSPTVTLCQQLGGNYASSGASSYGITNVDPQEYCLLADDNMCRLGYVNSSVPECTPVPVGWRPLTTETEAALVASLTASFTQTQPSVVTIVEERDKVGKGTELWFVSPPLANAHVEEVALTVTKILAQIGWHEDAASVETEASDWLEMTNIYRSQFTNRTNLCQSTIAWLPSPEFLNCPENSSYRDCILDHPETFVFTLILTCADSTTSPAS